MGRQAVIVSFRLGGDDGVSVEARKWDAALRGLGFETRRVAGEISGEPAADDVVIPGLAIDAAGAHRRRRTAGSDRRRSRHLRQHRFASTEPRRRAPHHADRRRAARAACVSVTTTSRGNGAGSSISSTSFRHASTGALHATINLRSRRELEARGYAGAATIHNYFDLDPRAGDRADDAQAVRFRRRRSRRVPSRTRDRAQERPGRLALRAAVQLLAPDRTVRYWLAGLAEDGYGATLERLIEHAPVPAHDRARRRRHRRVRGVRCRRVPVDVGGIRESGVEAIAVRRPCAAFPYPVLAEIVAAGVRTFSTERPDQTGEVSRRTPRSARARYHEVNLHRARISFDLAQLPAAIDDTFAQHGWVSW